jgi:cytochrome P450
MSRKALKDFTFSDGTFIPKGTFVCAATLPMHRDEENYSNSNVFDGFRFADMRMSEGESVKHQFVRDTSLCISGLFSFGFSDVLGGYKSNLSSVRSWKAFVVCSFPCLFKSLVFMLFHSPGRFFAANELKAMLAHLVLNYDVKLENEGVRPTDVWYGPACVPNQTAEVMFRKRRC